MKIYSGNSNKPLAEKIAKHLGLKLSPLEISVFPDGEKRVRVEDKVLDRDSFVIQSTNTPADGNYMELFLIIDALKRSGAKSVKVIIPYMGYQRQDHIFRDGEGVSMEVMVKILESLGISGFYTFDLHTPKIEDIFSVPAYHLSALPLFAEKIRQLPTINNPPVLVSPDMGGIRRIKELSQILGNVPYATIVKNRDLETGNINDSSLDGDVRGKTAVIVDDMVSTGTTLVDACQLVLENGAEKVYAFATHAVFSDNASDNLEQSRIERVFVTDTIDIPEEKQFPKLEVLSVGKIAAKALEQSDI